MTDRQQTDMIDHFILSEDKNYMYIIHVDVGWYPEEVGHNFRELNLNPTHSILVYRFY